MAILTAADVSAACAEMARLQDQVRDLKFMLRCALDWIDTVPADIGLPTMPGFDRDAADQLGAPEVPA